MPVRPGPKDLSSFRDVFFVWEIPRRLARLGMTEWRNNAPKLEKVSPVDIWKQIILRFALREKIAIDLSALKLVRQFREP